MRQDGGSIVYEAVIDSSKIKSGLSGAESQMEKSGEKAAKGYGAKFGAIAGITASITNKAMSMVSNSIDGAISRVDTLNNAPKVLQNLGFGAEESTKAINGMSKGIQGLPTSLDAAASALVRISAASGKGLDDATALTLAFNNMALSGGKGSQEAERAMVQYTQALGRGRFEGEEFNTMMEVMPAQMTQVAKSLLGPTANAGELKEAMSKGTVTMDQFNDEIVKLDKKGGKGFASFSKQAKDATGGIGTGMINLQTAVTRGVAGIIEAIGSENITSAITSIGTAFTTVLTAVASVINFIQEHQFVADILKAIGTALLVIGTGMAIWNAYQTAVRIATAVQIAFNAALAANPLGLVVLAIAAVVAALVYFFTQTETGKKIFEDFSGFLAGIFDTIKNVISVVWNWVKDNWPLLLAILTGPIGIAAAIIIQNWDTIKNAFKAAWEFIKGVWSAVTGWFGNVWQGIKNIFSAVGSWFGNIFTGAWNAVKNAFSSVHSFFTGVWTTVKNIFTGAGTAIGDAISGAFKGAVNNAFGTIENGINSAVALIDKVTPGSIGRVSLPRLATGGIVDSPTAAIIGEAGREAVLPLENNTGWMDELASKIGGGGNATVVVKIGEETIATKVIELINDKTRLSGNNSILV